MNPLQFFKRLFLLPVIAAFLQSSGCATGVTTTHWTEEQVRLVAPEWKLRVALYPGTPTSILQDPKSGESKGVGHDLGKEIARKLGVKFEPIIFSRNAEVLEAVKSGKADVAFTNASPARARDMDFSQPYLEIELGYLAAPRSRVAVMTDVDLSGVRVAVTEGSSSDGVLSRSLKNAVVVRAATIKIGVQMLTDGLADVYATNKSTLFEMADELPGSRVLEGNWGAEKHAVALPKGREAGMPMIREIVDEAIASGFVNSAIHRAGLKGAVVPRSR